MKSPPDIVDALIAFRRRNMSEYWVVGGEYADSRFASLLAGRQPERYGPFRSYEDARKEWQARTMATIDNALVRYQVVNERATAAA
jgi:hypothetical protein